MKVVVYTTDQIFQQQMYGDETISRRSRFFTA